MIWWRKPAGIDEARWVVLDVETSGLDAERDRLLAIAAIAVVVDGGTPQIAVGDSFEVVLRQEDAPVDKANILLHGIGVGAQREGVPRHEALEAFAAWLGASPLIAFHSSFDETMIRRAMHEVLGRKLANPWLDLALLAPAVVHGVRGQSLDDWMAHCGITCAVRHQAAADTHATAELLLKLWPAIAAQRAGTSFAALARLAASARWLPRG
jgi:DNA polymerase-3 subunit epsilon